MIKNNQEIRNYSYILFLGIWNWVFHHLCSDSGGLWCCCRRSCSCCVKRICSTCHWTFHYNLPLVRCKFLGLKRFFRNFNWNFSMILEGSMLELLHFAGMYFRTTVFQFKIKIPTCYWSFNQSYHSRWVVLWLAEKVVHRMSGFKLYWETVVQIETISSRLKSFTHSFRFL